MRVDELIQTLQQERSRIEAMLAELTPAQMERPGVEADWSVKDILAHLTGWDHRGTEWIRWAREVAQGDRSQVPEAGYSAQDLDWLNQENWLRNKDRDLQAVMDDFRQSFPPLLAQVHLLGDGDLETIIQSDWTDHQPVTVGEIVAWRYWHCREHGRSIAHWIDHLRQD